MRIPLYIVVNDKDNSCCSESCPFADGCNCFLFEVERKDLKLPEGMEWNDCDPYKVRVDECKEIDNGTG